MELTNNDAWCLELYRRFIEQGTAQDGQRIAVQMYDEVKSLEAESAALKINKDTDRAFIKLYESQIAALKAENERLRARERKRLDAWEEYHKQIEVIAEQKSLIIEPLYFCAKCGKELNINAEARLKEKRK